jgi:phosphonate transport system substrate-binding protein
MPRDAGLRARTLIDSTQKKCRPLEMLSHDFRLPTVSDGFLIRSWSFSTKASALGFCRRVIPASLALLLALVMGCHDQREEALAPVGSRGPEALRIGLLPEHNLFSQKKRYEPVAKYLSQQTGTEVVLVVLSRYGNVIDNFVSNELDGAFFGSFTGALAHRMLGVEALARPEWFDGTSTYHGLIFVRKDSGIRTAEDMKGKRFAFVDKATTAGWLLPLHYFKLHGIRDPFSWLSEAYFTGTHEGAIYDVLERKADIGAAKNTVFYPDAEKDPRIADELTVLIKSPDVPANGLCVRKDLNRDLKRRLKEALLNMDRDKEGRKILKDFGAARFIPTTEEDYAVVFDFAQEVGLDLQAYHYTNE